jgi:signal transduction histidine kinase
MAGGDEIADVDRAFHEMAASLLVQKQENEMFVYSVSHDLRSPLINLQGFSEELRLSYDDMRGLFEREGMPRGVVEQGRKLMKENIAESIRYIQVAVGRLSRIIDALLRLSRAGRVHYDRQALDVGAIVQKVVDALHETITTKNAEISVQPLPAALGDPTAIEQVFANLLANAVSYLDSERPGRIEVGSLPEPDGDAFAGRNVYYVKDNGLGIPEAYHERVFTAFTRLHANVAQVGEGIGLALIRRIVERHGGMIWMESSPGVGTTFFVALPSSPLESAGLGDEPSAFSTEDRRGELSQWPRNRS